MNEDTGLMFLLEMIDYLDRKNSSIVSQNCWRNINYSEPDVGEWIFYLTPNDTSIYSACSAPLVDDISKGVYVGDGRVEYSPDSPLDEVAVWSPMPSGWNAAANAPRDIIK